MKCLSLWQPWATLIVIGAKQFETRSWPTTWRGPLLIHAAKKRDAGSRSYTYDVAFQRALIPAGYRMYEDLPFGAVLGVVDMVDCWFVRRDPDDNGKLWAGNRSRGLPIGDEGFFGNYAHGRYAWQLANPRRFPTPVPLKAWQGIFNVSDKLVAEQMARAVTP